MKGQWIFFLLCLSSFVGEIAFGSIFPTVLPEKTHVPEVITQQEVTWPSENTGTIQGVIVGEDKIYTRNVQAEEQTRETNSESARNDGAVSPKVVVVVDTEQKPAPPTEEITVTRNNSETEIKKSLHSSSD